MPDGSGRAPMPGGAPVVVAVAVVNRVVLALAGAVLLAGAASAARWGGDRVLHAGLRQLEQAGGGFAALAGALGAAAGLALLAAQPPRRPPRRLRLAAPGCSLDGRALRRAVRAGCSGVPGVVRTGCRLARRGRDLELSLTLRIACGTDPGEVLARVSTGVLPPFEELLAPRRLATRIRLTVRHPGPRPRSRFRFRKAV
ncbi:hypothetical protein [Streptomyces omiyaensis]|uniref:hypothetical protein n=1 Tax=Streptomyces omiyaensis TaxID=68247 RepID=UPI0036FAD002